MALDENLAMIAESAARSAAGPAARCSTTPSTSSTATGPTPSTPCATLRAAAEAGAGVLVLCDTNGGSLPEQVGRGGRRGASGPARRPGWASTPTTTAAWPWPTPWRRCAAGATQVQGTINGLGERCGNADLTAIIPNLVLQVRLRAACAGCAAQPDGGQPLRLRGGQPEPAATTSRSSGPAPSPTRAACTCTPCGGTPRTYEHVDPAVVGNTRRILVSELSGASNIAAKADAKFKLDQRPARRRRRFSSRVVELEKPGLPVRGGRGELRAAGPQDARRTLVTSRSGSWSTSAASSPSRTAATR